MPACSEIGLNSDLAPTSFPSVATPPSSLDLSNLELFYHEIARIVCGVLLICLAIYFWLFLRVANHEESGTAGCSLPMLCKGKKLVIEYTDREKTILPILALMALGFIVVEILSVLFGDEYYWYDFEGVYSNDDDSRVFTLSRLMIFLQFLEKQMILGWMLHEHRSYNYAARNVILRIISASGSLLVAFVFIVFFVFERVVLLRILLGIINVVNIIVTMFSIIFGRHTIVDCCSEYVCGCGCFRSFHHYFDGKHGPVGNLSTSVSSRISRDRSRQTRSPSMHQTSRSLSIINSKNNDSSDFILKSFFVIFALFMICGESAMFVFDLQIPVSNIEFISYKYQWYVTLTRFIMFIYCLIIIIVRSSVVEKEALEAQTIQRQRSNNIRRRISWAQDNNNDQEMVQLGTRKITINTGNGNRERVSSGDDADDDDEIRGAIQRDKFGVSTRVLDRSKFSESEQEIIKDYRDFCQSDRKKNAHKFENTTATFIGAGGVGKTLLVRALWKGEIAEKISKRYDNTALDIEQMANLKQSSRDRRGDNNINLNYNDDRIGISADMDIDFDRYDVRPANLETALEDYNHYNLIDFYCRWDTVLRRSFRFYDTVGDLRFFKNSLNCMKKSDIVIAMYNLTSSTHKSIKFLKSFDKKLFEVFNHDSDINGDTYTGGGTLSADNEDHQHKRKYGTIVIGVSSMPLTTRLQNQHNGQVKKLSGKLKHLKILNHQAIYIDHKTPCQKLRIADLVDLLLKIERGKEEAIQQRLSTNNYKLSIFKCTNFECCIKRDKKVNTYEQLIVREVKERHMIMNNSILNAYTNIEKNKDKRKIVRGPVCVHYTQFTRPKGKILKRFLICFIGGLVFFPVIITMQTCLFWLYSADWGFTNDGLAVLIAKFSFKDLGQLPLDFLYGLPWFYRGLADPLMDAGLRSLFERQILTTLSNDQRSGTGGTIGHDSSNVQSTQYNSAVDWFLRQTFSQKIWRTVIVFCALTLEISIGYNVYYFFRHGSDAENQISNLESIGGAGLFVWFWIMVSAWYAGNTVVSNSNVNLLTNSKQKQSMRMLFKPIYSGGFVDKSKTSLYTTNVDVFLRGYAFARNPRNFENNFYGSSGNGNINGNGACCNCNCKISIKTLVFVFVCLVFAFLPGIIREIQGRNYEYINGECVADHKFIPINPGWDDWETDVQRNTVFRAIIINFTCLLLVISFLDNIRITSFGEYLEIMKYITKLVEIPRAETKDKSEMYMTRFNNTQDGYKNTNKFSDDIFTDRSETEHLIQRRTQIDWSTPHSDDHETQAMKKNVYTKLKPKNNSQNHEFAMDEKKYNEDDVVNVASESQIVTSDHGADDADDSDDDDGESDLLEENNNDDHGLGLKFLCLDDPENLVAYMEIRDYAYSTGKQLFGELEPLVTISGLVIIGQASWVIGALWVREGLEGQSVYGAYYLFIITLGWAIWCMFLGRKFDKLQSRQVKALTNQRACMQSEIITQAVFTCPDIWNDLKVGTWNKLYELTHRYSKIFENSCNNTDNDNDNDNDDNVNDRKRFQELKYLQNSFSNYIEWIKTCQNKLEENNIHPKIFGINLSGALFNTVIGTIIAAVIALIKLIFY